VPDLSVQKYPNFTFYKEDIENIDVSICRYFTVYGPGGAAGYGGIQVYQVGYGRNANHTLR
jgi:nucleoside-diphosphate-sugar epimerase